MEFTRNLSCGNRRYQCLTNGGDGDEIFCNADSLDDAFHERLEENLHCLKETVSLLNVVRTAPLHLKLIIKDFQVILSRLKESWSQLLESSNDVSVNLSINSQKHMIKATPTRPIFCWRVRRTMTISSKALPSISKTLPITPRKAVIKYLNHAITNLHDHLSILKSVLLRLNLSFIEEDQKKIINDVYRHQTQLGVLKEEMRTFISKKGVFNWKFKCAKAEVESWWQSHFNDNFMLEWSDFIQVFAEHFKLKSANIIQEMQQSININNTDYMSKFKFDLFTRLFSPWSNLSKVWKVIVMNHPGFSGISNYEEASELLRPYLSQPGSYLFRYSATKYGFWCIAFIKHDNTVAHIHLKDLNLVEALIMGHKQKIYRYPRGRSKNPDLAYLLEPAVRITIDDVANEFSVHEDSSSSSTLSPSGNMNKGHLNSVQDFSLPNPLNSGRFQGTTSGSSSNVYLRSHSVHCHSDETFSCSICFENKKNTQLEPCLHILCRICFSKWMNYGDNCPFCREVVRSFRRVILECKCGRTSNDPPLPSSHRNLNPSPSVMRPTSCTSHKGAPPQIPQPTTSLSTDNNELPPPIPRRLGEEPKQ